MIGRKLRRYWVFRAQIVERETDVRSGTAHPKHHGNWIGSKYPNGEPTRHSSNVRW